MKEARSHSKRSPVKVRLQALLKDICAFVDKASDEQRRMLLNLLEDRRFADLLHIARHAERREHPRKACAIAVDCATEGRAFKGLVKNISLGGMFIACIKTDRMLSVGQRITIGLPGLSNRQGPLELQGEVVWATPDGVGVGVKFTTAFSDLEPILASL